MSENNFIRPLLTDFYQVTMCYAYWKNNHHNDHAVFDAFFRKCPFKGEYCIIAGIDTVINFLSTFKINQEEINYLRTQLPQAENEFFDWLQSLDASQTKVYAIPEGSIVFPRENVLRIEGPLAFGQLIETTILNLINFASLIATNANRIVRTAAQGKQMLEFGLRRAQGPDGAMTATRCSYIGGFNSTSNVQGGMIYGIPIAGTHAHAYVTSYTGPHELNIRELNGVDLYSVADEYRQELGWNTNDGELAAFVSYAIAHPNNFLALIDTYDSLHSGIKNFLCVGLALNRAGIKPLGIRLDSGDLAYISKEARKMFKFISDKYNVDFYNCRIAASNDLNESVIQSLNSQNHEIDIFGVGTNLVTCQSQPALGMVYKLVEIRGLPRIKLSETKDKITLPCRKNIYRLYGKDNQSIVDLICLTDEEAPVPGERILVRHPFDDIKRLYVTPSKVELLHELVFDGQKIKNYPLQESRERVQSQLSLIRDDVLRLANPTPYKVSVSPRMFEYLNELWLAELPIKEIS